MKADVVKMNSKSFNKVLQWIIERLKAVQTVEDGISLAIKLYRTKKHESNMHILSCFFIYLSISPYFTLILSILPIIGSAINQRKKAVEKA